MRISQLKIRGFRCFGHDTTTIKLDDLTAFIGKNGSGKTAVLQALARMFGTAPGQKEVVMNDFHLEPGEDVESKDERKLMVEVRLEFPELENDPDNELGAVPPSFAHMVVDDEGEPPYARIRLEATWTKTELEGGDTQSTFSWLETTDEEPQPNADRRQVQPHDRARIQLYYVPAARDTSRQLANVSGTLLNQLLRSIKWSEETKQDIKEKTEAVREVFDQVAPIELITTKSRTHWRKLYDGNAHADPCLKFIGTDFVRILREARIVFNPAHHETDHDIEQLSEGQQSLFYFAFIKTLFDIRREVNEAQHTEPDAEGAITKSISYDDLRPGYLTLFAVEEPENHLSPHYLGRIMAQVVEIAEVKGSQVLVTSHSAAIVGRVDPSSVRHCSLDDDAPTSLVREIVLPNEGTDAFKFVKEAVRAYPELYFARLVILGEGDTEEMLLHKFAALSGRPLDIEFVSVVPLGGRFVHHIWRLLKGLDIKFVTLLDLDIDRARGGWSTVKHILKNVLRYLPEAQHEQALTFTEADKSEIIVSIDDLSDMHGWDDDRDRCIRFARQLERFDVFVSAPLDLDFLMLSEKSEMYLTEDETKTVQDADQIERAVKRCVGDESESYLDAEKSLMYWYVRKFLGRGKPVTHFLAWQGEEGPLDTDSLPEPLDRMFKRIRELLPDPNEE